MRPNQPKRSSRTFAWGAVLLGLGALSGFGSGRGLEPVLADRLLLACVALSAVGALLLIIAITRVLKNLDDVADYFFRQQRRALELQQSVDTSELPKLKPRPKAKPKAGATGAVRAPAK